MVIVLSDEESYPGGNVSQSKFLILAVVPARNQRLKTE